MKTDIAIIQEDNSSRVSKYANPTKRDIWVRHLGATDTDYRITCCLFPRILHAKLLWKARKMWFQMIYLNLNVASDSHGT